MSVMSALDFVEGAFPAFASWGDGVIREVASWGPYGWVVAIVLSAIFLGLVYQYMANPEMRS